MKLQKEMFEELYREMHSMFIEFCAVHNQIDIDLAQTINLINGEFAEDHTSGLLKRIDSNYFNLFNYMTILDKVIANVLTLTLSSSIFGTSSKLKLPPLKTFSSKDPKKQFANWQDAMKLWMIGNKYGADNQTYTVMQLLHRRAKKVAEKHLLEIKQDQTSAVADI